MYMLAPGIARTNVTTALRQYWFELILGLGIAGISLYSLFSHSSYVAVGLLYASLISYLLCFTLTSFFLNRQNVKFLDRMFLSILSMLAGIILFEIVYHYGFGISQAQLIKDFTFLGNGTAQGSFPLDWYLLIFVSIFIGRKYMTFNKSLIVLTLFGAVAMFVWIGSGYPQSFDPPWTANYLPIYQTFHVVYTTSNMIVQYASFFTDISKTIAIIPAFFFNKKLSVPSKKMIP